MWYLGALGTYKHHHYPMGCLLEYPIEFLPRGLIATVFGVAYQITKLAVCSTWGG